MTVCGFTRPASSRVCSVELQPPARVQAGDLTLKERLVRGRVHTHPAHTAVAAPCQHSRPAPCSEPAGVTALGGSSWRRHRHPKSPTSNSKPASSLMPVLPCLPLPFPASCSTSCSSALIAGAVPNQEVPGSPVSAWWCSSTHQRRPQAELHPGIWGALSRHQSCTFHTWHLLPTEPTEVSGVSPAQKRRQPTTSRPHTDRPAQGDLGTSILPGMADRFSEPQVAECCTPTYTKPRDTPRAPSLVSGLALRLRAVHFSCHHLTGCTKS